jgi:hypothetical protein
MPSINEDEPIGKGTTTLDYLRARHEWLGVLIDEADAKIKQLAADVDKLQKFKDWVHGYLDSKGVPHHPPGTHGAEGCRIGDRIDWMLARTAELEETLAAHKEATGIVKDVTYVDDINRAVHREAERAAKAEARGVELEKALEKIGDYITGEEPNAGKILDIISQVLKGGEVPE